MATCLSTLPVWPAGDPFVVLTEFPAALCSDCVPVVSTCGFSAVDKGATAITRKGKILDFAFDTLLFALKLLSSKSCSHNTKT